MKDYEQKYWHLYYKQDGLCYVCQNPLHANGTKGELAHRIIKSKENIRRHGLDIIDHVFNLRLTCARCNSAVIIEHKKMKKQELLKQIKLNIGVENE